MKSYFSLEVERDETTLEWTIRYHTFLGEWGSVNALDLEHAMTRLGDKILQTFNSFGSQNER